MEFLKSLIIDIDWEHRLAKRVFQNGDQACLSGLAVQPEADARPNGAAIANDSIVVKCGNRVPNLFLPLCIFGTIPYRVLTYSNESAKRWNMLINIFKYFIFLLATTCFFTGTSYAATSSIEGIQVYQKNVHASPERKRKLADDIKRYRSADNLWDVLRDEFTLPHYEENPAVQEKIEWFMNNQDFLLRSATRSAPYLYYILQQVKKRHLPAELVLLPIVESGYNPLALSPMGAAGIWQLMPGTASGYGVKRDWWYDGRRDVIASTRGALNYLAYLQSFFDGNWLLAIAAYNTGEGNVLSAIKRNIRNGMDTDFWSLPVAQETKDYVPSLLALATIISHPDQYPIYFPPVRNAPYLAQVDIETQINLKFAASLAGISHQKLMQLNPGFSRPSTSAKGPYKLVLPIENVAEFTENLSRTPLNRRQVEWVHYKVKTGDTLASIAKKFKTTTLAIKKLNHFSSKQSNIKHGLNILIPQQATLAQNTIKEKTLEWEASEYKTEYKEPLEIKQTSAEASVPTNGKYTLQPGDTIYMVRSTDSLESISNHFHVASNAILAANEITRSKVLTGKQLIIPTHAAKEDVVRAGDTIYMVRSGDTIDKIAKKFRTTPAAIRLANLIDDGSLVEGEKILVPTHLQG